MKPSTYSTNSPSKKKRAGAGLESVDQVLAAALKRFGLDSNIARYKFVLHWKEIMGDRIASITQPESINRQTLIVRVTDSAWAQELAFQKESIIKRLQRFLADDTIITDIHFYVGKTVANS